MKEEELAAAQERAAEALAEDQAVPHRPPEDGDHPRAPEALGEDREHVLPAHEPAVEEGEAGQGHEQHEGRGGHDPGVVSRAGDAADLGRPGVGSRPSDGEVLVILLQVADPLLERGFLLGEAQRAPAGQQDEHRDHQHPGP